MLTYEKSLVEVQEILNYLPDEDYEKIPDEIINLINENKDPNYIWNYDESKLASNVAAENDVLFRTSSVEDLLEDWHIYVPNGPNIHLINNEEDIAYELDKNKPFWHEAKFILLTKIIFLYKIQISKKYY